MRYSEIDSGGSGLRGECCHPKLIPETAQIRGYQPEAQNFYLYQETRSTGPHCEEHQDSIVVDCLSEVEQVKNLLAPYTTVEYSWSTVLVPFATVEY